VLGVSYDTPEKNRKFAEKNELPFRLLSDGDHALAKKVGASRTLIPFAKRISYLIGADGTVLAAYPKVDPASHAREVLEDYRAFIVSDD
jgi:peroxiredoxin Q/BCP